MGKRAKSARESIAGALAEIRATRLSKSLGQLSDGELLMLVANSMGKNDEERRFAAYALAVWVNPAPTPERIRLARDQLENLGIGGFSSTSLLAMYNDPTYDEFYEAWSEWMKAIRGSAEAPSEDRPALLNKLAVRAGAIAAL